ncbi:MAG: ribosomal L7Ae/L30e/S12e/Gadd45 family protein [Bacillota bacterium]
MLEKLKEAKQKVAGARQTIRALENNLALVVYIARDAEEKVINPVLRLCEQGNVPVHYVDSMEQLGKACKIKVGAAVAAITEK